MSCGRGAARRRPSSDDGSLRSRSRDRPRTRRRSRAGSSATPASRRRSCRRSTACASCRTERTHTSARPTTPSAAHARISSASSSSTRGRSCRSTTSATSRRRGCSPESSTGPACVIVKHANPCGVAVADTIEEAYAKALAADPVSAYGGVVVVNRAVTAALAEALATQFVEVLFAPAYDVGALDRLAGKEALRVLEHTDQRALDDAERDYRRVMGGLLVQDRDRETTGRERCRGRVRGGLRRAVGRPSLRVARREARDVERDRARASRPDARNRGGADEPGGRRAHRDPEGTRARPLARRRGARLGRLLPVRGRAEARARRRDRRLHPARRLEARRRGHRGAVRSGRVDGLHGRRHFRH